MINEASNQYMEPLCMQQILPPLTGLASITQRGRGHKKQTKANIDAGTEMSPKLRETLSCSPFLWSTTVVTRNHLRSESSVLSVQSSRWEAAEVKSPGGIEVERIERQAILSKRCRSPSPSTSISRFGVTPRVTTCGLILTFGMLSRPVHLVTLTMLFSFSGKENSPLGATLTRTGTPRWR